mgnify:CR=1 FL=1
MNTKHIWIDGPDGHNYHCPSCGISRCDDYDAHSTCIEWVLYISDESHGSLESRFEMNNPAWEKYIEDRSSKKLQK